MIPPAVFAETLLQFLAPIRAFLEDPTVSDICINGHDTVFVERAGRLVTTDARFADEEALTAAVRNLAQYVGKHVSAHHPILEARLPDGSRVEAILPPAAPGGPQLAIRKFSKRKLDMARLAELGTVTHACAAAVAALVAAKFNIVVAGGTGTGKTSLLNALSACIPEDERVVVIEDSKEVQLQRAHVVQLEARPPDARGAGEVTIRDLFRATLRMRPDRIVVGEIRGGEALEIVQAMTSGHGGCLATLHATHPHDTLMRLETMALMSQIDLPLPALRTQIASGVQIIVQIKRLRDGSRVVSHVAQVLGFDTSTGTYVLRPMFERQYRPDDEGGRIRSELIYHGIDSRFLSELDEHGVRWPSDVLAQGHNEIAKNAFAKGA